MTRRRGLTYASLWPLSDAEVAAEIAGLQWELVIEAAQAAYHAPKEDRARELSRLTASESIIDRYAARLVREWRQQDSRRP